MPSRTIPTAASRRDLTEENAATEDTEDTEIEEKDELTVLPNFACPRLADAIERISPCPLWQNI